MSKSLTILQFALVVLFNETHSIKHSNNTRNARPPVNAVFATICELRLIEFQCISDNFISTRPGPPWLIFHPGVAALHFGGPPPLARADTPGGGSWGPLRLPDPLRAWDARASARLTSFRHKGRQEDHRKPYDVFGFDALDVLSRSHKGVPNGSL